MQTSRDWTGPGGCAKHRSQGKPVEGMAAAPENSKKNYILFFELI